MPNNATLHSISWNGEQGWIACGASDGMLKVLKLDASGSKDGNVRGLAAPNNLSMNQTLEGHNGNVVCVTWNENYRKLTTSDESGMIIVWMLYKGMWYEEMVNSRNKSVVRDMSWSGDGQKICIIYEDGAVIVGSVDGNRIWGSELKMNLLSVAWSPDNRRILFGTKDNQVHVYDNTGSSMYKVTIYCLEDASPDVKLVSIRWYDGSEGYVEPNCPSLCIAYSNGRIQLMRSETDDNPVLLDTGLNLTRVCWNYGGSALAVAGVGVDDKVCMVQFYDPNGVHLRTLKMSGSHIYGISWEGQGLRIALAVDTYIYFANIRPDYRWAYFGRTLLYAYAKADRPEQCVVFWDTRTDEKYIKYVKRLINLKAAGDNALMVTRTEEPGQYLLILCNEIGTPVDSKYVNVEPLFVSITKYHVIVASEEVVYVWQYRTAVSKLTSYESSGGALAIRKKEGRERTFHISDVPQPEGVPLTHPTGDTDDTITCICANEECLLVGRESGTVQRYSLPHLALEAKYVLKCRPQLLAVNCNSTRFSVVDINGILTFFEMDSAGGPSSTESNGRYLNVERKDVWDMLWSDDNPELFAMMEKTRMYIFRGEEPEEPVSSSGYLCKFSDLEVRAALLDEIMVTPDRPNRDFIINFETRSLRDTRSILSEVGLKDTYKFVQSNPHPRLWRMLAEAALEQLEFSVSEEAFVLCQDYQGIQFVKRLKLCDDKRKQKAEVATYFKRFSEAEEMYLDMDRKDLALELRVQLGDWFRVEQLAEESFSTNDEISQTAALNIGEYYADRLKWSRARKYFERSQSYERLIECYFILEDFDALFDVIGKLPEGSPLLLEIGRMFQAVGLSTEATTAFLRGNDVKSAIDTCVHLNQWDKAVSLAEKHNFQQIEGVLSRYASHLLEEGRQLDAVQLYRKAGRHMDAAKILASVAEEEGKNNQDCMLAKKLYVMSALEVEENRKKMLDDNLLSAQQSTVQTLQGLLTEDMSVAGTRSLDNPWHGAEAFHFFMLAQRQMYENKMHDAMKTAARLREYDDVLPARIVYSLLALAAYHTSCYRQSSRAFIKLESLEDLDPQERAKYETLAVQIFTKHPPDDLNLQTKEVQCPRCNHMSPDWSPSCSSCGNVFPACMVTGAPLLAKTTFMCAVCKHRAHESSIQGLNHCPLCHSYLR